MTQAEFAARFRARRYVQAKYRSEDTRPNRALVLGITQGQGLSAPLALAQILAASYPDLALITN